MIYFRMLAEGIGWISLFFGAFAVAFIFFFELYRFIRNFHEIFSRKGDQLDGFGIKD